MVPKSPKTQINSSMSLFEPKMFKGKYFGGDKTDDEFRNLKFENLDPFCDVMDPQIEPKWSKNHLKRQKSQ